MVRSEIPACFGLTFGAAFFWLETPFLYSIHDPIAQAIARLIIGLLAGLYFASVSVSIRAVAYAFLRLAFASPQAMWELTRARAVTMVQQFFRLAIQVAAILWPLGQRQVRPIQASGWIPWLRFSTPNKIPYLLYPLSCCQLE